MVPAKSLISSGITIVGLATMAGAASAATITIDDFQDQQFVLPGSSDAVQGSGILGGEREATYVSEENNPFGANLQVGNGFLTLNSFFPLVEADLVWDGLGNSGLGGVDLTDGGTEAGLAIDIFGIGTSVPDPELTLTFSLLDLDGNESTSVQSFATDFLLDNASLNSPVTAFFGFGGFAGTADVSRIDSIALNIIGPSGLDLNFGPVKTAPVPEPLTILGSMAAVGFGVAMKRRLTADVEV